MLRAIHFLSFGALAAISCLPMTLGAEAGVGDGLDQATLIRKELQQMRDEYEARIKKMELRIAELEQSKQTPPVIPVAPVPQTAKEAPSRIPPHTHSQQQVASGGSAKAGMVATEPVIPEGFQFDKVTTGLTFNGYFRSGYGVNGKGDSMEAFRAPGAQAKYRLGNETETYVETAFGYTFPKLNLAQGTEFSIHFRPAYVVNNSAQSALTDLTVREAYGEAKGIWAAQPEASFWAGQRFYGRMDVHMNDFYYMDMSGYGGGVENIDVGLGKLSVAWLGGNIDDYNSNATEVIAATDNKNTLDFRLSDIDVFGGEGLVWMSLSQTDDLLAPNGINVDVDSSTGAAFGLGYRYVDVFGGMNKSYSQTMLQYGFGASANFRATQSDYSFVADPVDLDNPSLPLRIDAGDAWHFRLTQDLVYQPNQCFALQGTFVWDEFDFGAEVGSRRTWVSGGARGVYFLTDYFNLVLEAGVDHVSGDDQPSGNLYKITFAPELTPKREYFSRPALRFFVTYAMWDKDLQGMVAPISYGMDTEGISVGMQVEAWW